MSKSIKDSAFDLLRKFEAYRNSLRKYALLCFVVFIAGAYGFVLFRINTLSQAQPSEDAVSNQVQAARAPHIDENVVQQLKSLQDNSVNVQSLFDDARTNPFQQ